MKKIFLFTFILCTNWCVAQVFVNHKNLTASTDQYIEVWEKYNSKSGKFFAMIDYGQATVSDENGARLKIHDTSGGFLQFNNTIAILNYLHLNGWEIVQIKKMDTIDSYLMKRRAEFGQPDNNQHVNTTIGSID